MRGGWCILRIYDELVLGRVWSVLALNFTMSVCTKVLVALHSAKSRILRSDHIVAALLSTSLFELCIGLKYYLV